jgi:hypothetical protein
LYRHACVNEHAFPTRPLERSGVMTPSLHATSRGGGQGEQLNYRFCPTGSCILHNYIAYTLHQSVHRVLLRVSEQDNLFNRCTGMYRSRTSSYNVFDRGRIKTQALGGQHSPCTYISQPSVFQPRLATKVSRARSLARRPVSY